MNPTQGGEGVGGEGGWGGSGEGGGATNSAQVQNYLFSAPTCIPLTRMQMIKHMKCVTRGRGLFCIRVKHEHM